VGLGQMAIESIGKYEVLGTLGEGANSTIFHIRRHADQGDYALKVVPIESKEDRKYLEQAEDEFRIARKLDHPNVIQIYALEKKRSLLRKIQEVRMLLEYVPGRTLDEYKQIPLPALLPIFVQIAAGLEHIHKRGVFHADLKPNNILLTKEGKIKIIDFGLAWLKGEPKDRVQGTPEYMAPEQIKKKIVDAQTDIFNFGATMYRLIAGRTIPSFGELGGLVNEATWGRMLIPIRECKPETPPSLAKLIHHCLAYKPADRPKRVSEVKAALKEMRKKAPPKERDDD
jgi:serine/threonine protein kinase